MTARISTKKVAFIGQTEYFRCHYETDLDADCTVFEKHLVWDAPSSWYDDLLEFNADINIFFRGDLVPLSVVEALKGLRVSYSTEPFPKLLNGGSFDYTLDSLGRFEQFTRIQNYPFEYVLHYDEASKSFLEGQGFELSGYVPLPIATEAYCPVEAPRERDILFLGRSTAHRERHLGQLKLDFDTFHIAHGWPPLRRDRGSTADLTQLVNQFRICLNLHAEEELSWEPRMQLMMACGALVVSEPISPNPYLQPDVHFVEIRTPAELYRTCCDIVSDPDRFDVIRETGHREVVRSLSARACWPRLFESLALGHYERPVYEPNRSRIKTLEICKRYNGFDHLLDSLRSAHG
ncbi:MAG: glycosyltransferase [Acetobacteraceae bacterium]